MQASGWPAAPPSASQRRNMVERNPFTDQQIQDYIDGRLGERDRAAVAAYLLAHPRVAADVEAVRRQSDALRALGHEILDEPVPAHLRRIVHARRALCTTELRPDPPATRQPASHVRSFLKSLPRFSCSAPAARPAGSRTASFGPRRSRRRCAPRSTASIRSMACVTNRSPFRRSARKSSSPGSAAPSRARCGPPDLDEFGYSYRGGRVVPSAGVNVGLFEFERPTMLSSSMFFWTSAAPPRLDRDNLTLRL